MDVERFGGDFRDGVDEGGAEGNVIHQMTIHDIEMMPVRARRLGAQHFLVQTSEIAGENRWSDEDRMSSGIWGSGFVEVPGMPQRCLAHKSQFPSPNPNLRAATRQERSRAGA